MNMRPPCSRDDVFEKLNSGEDEETAQRRIIDGLCLGRRFGRNICHLHVIFVRLFFSEDMLRPERQYVLVGEGIHQAFVL